MSNVNGIQVGIRLKPLEDVPYPVSTANNKKSMSLKSPFSLDYEPTPQISHTTEPSRFHRSNPWSISDEKSIVYSGQPLPDIVRPSPPLSFTFDSVSGPSVRTSTIYEELASELISSTLEGFNATIFAYGQTSSGKTYTMQGTQNDPGIIPLAINHLFDLINESQEKEFLLRVSYLEIYNEIITDLLTSDNTNLKIHETPEKGVFVGNLKEEIVGCWSDVSALMKYGEERRHIGQTNMNEYSSRSHTIFRMVIESRDKKSNELCEERDNYKTSESGRKFNYRDRNSFTGAVNVSCLNLVDLAGSERVGHTGAEGTRLKEGAYINKSLLSLGTVISKLADVSNTKDGSSTSYGHIPFRDSKLTRILQPALGGNARTLIICTINPNALFFEESCSTLKFASRARMIQNKPTANAILSNDAMLSRYRREISELKTELETLKAQDNTTSLVGKSLKDDLAIQLEEKEKETLSLSMKLEALKRMVLNSSSSDTVDGSANMSESSILLKKKRRQTWFYGETSRNKIFHSSDDSTRMSTDGTLHSSPVENGSREESGDGSVYLDSNLPPKFVATNNKELSEEDLDLRHAREIDAIKMQLHQKEAELSKTQDTLADLRQRHQSLDEMYQMKVNEVNEKNQVCKLASAQSIDQGEAYNRLEADSEKLQRDNLKLLIKQEELGSLLSSALAEISSTRNEKDLLIKQLQQVIVEIDNVQSELRTKDELIAELRKTVDENAHFWNDRSKSNGELKDQIVTLEKELSTLKQSYLSLTESHVLLEQELASESKKLSERDLAISGFEAVHESVKSQLKMVSLENTNLLDEIERIAVQNEQNLKNSLELEELNNLKDSNQSISKRLSEVESQLELSKNLLITQDKRHRSTIGEMQQVITEITQDKEQLLQHLETTQQDLAHTMNAKDDILQKLHAELEKTRYLENYIEEKKLVIARNQKVVLSYVTALELALHNLTGYQADVLDSSSASSLSSTSGLPV